MQQWSKIECVDDGYTGTNQNRPGFQKLLELAANQQAACILVKDLSRLGRNYVDVGYYVDVVFPSYRVRLIAVNDNYDSQQKGNMMDLAHAIVNIKNEMYSQDLSLKIRSVFTPMKKRGEYMGSVPPYGYCFHTDTGRKKLYVEEKSANWVRKIFCWLSEGVSASEIAKRLNQRGVDTPENHRRREKGQQPVPGKMWTYGGIQRIGQNVVYMGVMENNKTRTRLTTGQKNQKIPEENHYYVRNTHEAIVSEALFNQVNGRTYGRKSKRKKVLNE